MTTPNVQLTTTTPAETFLSQQIDTLLIKPLRVASIAILSGRFVQSAGSVFRIPILDSDATVAWTDEATDIDESVLGFSEKVSHFQAIKGLVSVSNEFLLDSNEISVGHRGRFSYEQPCKKIDSAYFGAHVTGTPEGLQTITPNAIDAGSAWTNVDWASEAIYHARGRGIQVSAFVSNPSTALALAKLKAYGATGSNIPLLDTDVVSDQPGSAPGQWQTIQGVQLLTSSANLADDC